MSYNNSPTRQCGIYYCLPSTGSFEYHWLPLSNLSAKAHIQHYSANVTLYQTFVVPPNQKGAPEVIKSTNYSFPIYPACSVNSFTAHIHSPGKPVRTIKGIIKGVEKAREIYDAAVSEGKTAGLLEQQAPDVFLMKLGNIPNAAGTEVKVEIGYVVELSHDSEVDGVRFVVPMAIAPRYGEFTPWNSGSSVRGASDKSVKNWGNVVSNGINIEVKVSMPGPVTGIQSPSHPISVIVGSHEANATGHNYDNARATAKLEMPNETFLGKDFVVLILCKEISAPQAILESCTPEIANTSALMLTFVPKFVVPPSSKPGLIKTRKEIIFLIDRSGSMENKVDSLRSALTVFIKSLPVNQNVVFDICSFGTQFEFLFHGAKHKGKPIKGGQVYNQETMNTALALVKKVKADLGGTELGRPIQAICEMAKAREQSRKPDDDVFETEILVLTDGEIWGVEQLCDYVREQTKGWRKDINNNNNDRSGIRVFTLGIGEDVSHSLVESLAKAGGGYSTIVGGNERYEGKVVRMLKAALSERLGNFKLFWEGMENWGLGELDSGAPPPYTAGAGNGTDDFEIVDAPEKKESTGKSPVPPEASSTPPVPINLYNPTADVDAPLDTTHKPTEKSPVLHLQPPILIQAPHTIPPLFPFSRVNIYVLLTPPPGTNPPPLPAKITLIGYTASGQALELSLPVTVLERPGTTIHELVTKKYLDDLRENDSWIHDAQGTGVKLRCTYLRDDGSTKDDLIELPESNTSPFGEENSKIKVDDLVSAEGERVGVSYSVVGKWTSFVAVEEAEAGNEKKEYYEIQTNALKPATSYDYERLERLSSITVDLCASSGGGGRRGSQKSKSKKVSLGLPSLGLGGAARRLGKMLHSAPPPPPPPHAAAMYQSAPAPNAAAMYQYAPAPYAAAMYQSAPAPPAPPPRAAAAAPAPYPQVPAGAVPVQSKSASSSTTAVSRRRSLFGGGKKESSAQHVPHISMEIPWGKSKEEGGEKLRASVSSKVSPAEQATSIIGYQQFDGYWSFKKSQDLVNFLKLYLPVSKSEKEIKGDESDLWATVLVLVFLERCLNGQDEKDMWDLVGEKGWEWVRGTVGGDEGKVQKIKQEVEAKVFV